MKSIQNRDLLVQCYENYKNGTSLGIYKRNLKYCYFNESLGDIDKALWVITDDTKFYNELHKMFISVKDDNSIKSIMYPD